MNIDSQLSLFAKENFLRSKSITDVKRLSLCTTRPDLLIQDVTEIKWFSPREYQNRENWKYQDFNYVISPLGLRGQALPESIDIAAFGCSFTFGQGLATEMLWHTLLADSLKLTSYNFGVSAANIKSICDMFSILVNHVRIKHAVFLLPPYHRLQIAAKNKENGSVELLPLIPNYSSNLESNFDLDAKVLYGSLPDQELLKIFKDQLYLIELIGKMNDVKIYVSSWDKETYNFLTEMDLSSTLLPEWNSEWHPDHDEDLTVDKARDDFHPGPLHHIKWSNKIKEFIQL